MPSWKKVITSGSDAVLNSVIATGSLNTINRELIYNNQTVLDWDLHQLAANGVISVEWDDRTLYDKSAEVSIDWDRRQLKGLDVNVMLDWSGSALLASASIYMSASTQLYGTASYALTSSLSNTSTVSVSSSITFHPVNTTYALVFTNNSPGNRPLHISPYGPQYDATANSISNIGSITSSNFVGTASYARQSLSSSYALTASYVAGVSAPNLQQVTDQGNTTTNNVIISASLIVSNSIDSNIRTLYDTAAIRSIDWTSRQLFDETGTIAIVDYLNRQLRTTADEVSVDWESYQLKNSNAYVTVDWNDWKLYANAGIWTLDWVSGLLRDMSGTGSADWDLRILTDNNNGGNGITSIDWGARTLYDASGTPVLYWSGSSQLILSASNLYIQRITTGSTNNVLTYNPTTGQVYYTASAAIGGSGTPGPTTPGGVNNNIQFNYNGTFDGNNDFNYYKGTSTVVLTGSLVVSGSTYLQALTTASVTNVLTYNPSTGQVYYTASSAIGNPVESDPVFTAWSGSVTSQFAGTSSFALTASLAPNYVLNTATSSFVLNSQTSSMTVLSSSFALTASYVQLSQTASFITGSNVYGPFGSNSIQSASYALTASYVTGLSPGGPTYAVQFNNEGAFDGKEAFSFNPNSSSLVMGYNASAPGQYATALGFNTLANRTGSLASGFYAGATNNYATSLGHSPDASGYASLATGIDTIASFSASFATGKDTLARANFASAHGLGSTAAGDASFVVGKYNKEYFNNEGGSGSFIVGAGSISNRRNYFEVMPELGYVSASGDFYNKEDVYFPGLPVTGSLPFVGIRASDGRLYRIGKIVLGTSGVAIGSDAISGGKDTQAIGDQGFSIGDATIANGTNAVSTGKDTNAVGSGSLTTGDTTTAVGDNSVATGKDTVAVGTSSLATGKGTVASGSNAVATGRDTIASGSNSMTAGSGSKADAENSVAFGKGTIAKTDEQVVIGRYNTADTQSLFVVGSGTSDANRKTIMKVDSVGARIDGSMTISGSSTFTNIGPAVFSGSIVQGGNNASGDYSVALGYQTQASGEYSVAMGRSSHASASYSTAMGYDTLASGFSSLTAGVGSQALGHSSIAGGTYTTASGSTATAFGTFTYAAGNSSFAAGAYSRANGLYSSVFGLRVTSSGDYQFAVGRFNLDIDNAAAFIIGNGTSNTSRSNLLVASGDVVQITGSLNINGNAVANSFTGSLLGNVIGTSSWASNAITSSFANTASFVNNLVQNVIVTGSVTATTFTGSLRGHVVTSSINTAQSLLINSFGSAVDWANSSLGYSGVASVLWASRVLVNSSNNTTVNWQSGILSDNSGNTSVNWINRDLKDVNAVTSVNYSSRLLYSSTSDSALDFSIKNKLTGYGAISTILDGAFFTATENTESINYYAGELYDGPYAIPGVAYGELLYLDYSTNEWVNIDQTTDSCTRYLAIDLKDKDGVLTEGHILMTDSADPFHPSMPTIENPLIGMPVYIKEGAGGGSNSYTCTIPTSGYVRVIGHVMYQSPVSGFETKYMIKFKPSNDWYEI